MSEKQSDKIKECLVMMPFTDPNGYSVGHFKRVYDYLINLHVRKRVSKQNVWMRIIRQVSSFWIFWI